MTRIAVTGSSGLVGRALTEHLRRRGDDVVRLVRRAPEADDEVRWDPTSGTVDRAALDAGGPVDAVVDLAGAGVGDRRWDADYRRRIRDSRVDATGTAARLVADLGPHVALVNASAVGWYGDRPGETLTEQSPPGPGFLPDVVVQWEAATRPAQEAGNRVALARTGIVLAAGGGALGRLLPLLRLGLGGPLGSGRQVWPWITLDDEVRALAALVDGPLQGPVNLVAPARSTQLELTRALAVALHRPALVPAPALALRVALGGFAGELLASQHVVPEALLGAGFDFRHPTVESAVDAVVRS